MRYKRFYRMKDQHKYYEKKELSKVQISSLSNIFSHKDLKILVLHKAYYTQNLKSRYSLRNFCIFSGRSRNLDRKFNVSRIILRDLSIYRIFSGLKKIS